MKSQANIEEYKRISLLNSILGYSARKTLRSLLLLASVLSLGAFVFVHNYYLFVGLFFIFISLFVILYMTEFWFNSYYYKDVSVHGYNSISFDLAEVLLRKNEDIVVSILRNRIGREILMRCGVTVDTLKNIIIDRPINKPVINISKVLSFADLFKEILAVDDNFRNAIFRSSVTENNLIECSLWVEKMILQRKRAKRFWGREYLARIPGMGKDWSYGKTYFLEKYGRYVDDLPSYSIASNQILNIDQPLEDLERSLSRSGESNVLLIAESSDDSLDLIARLAFIINKGKSYPELEHKKIFIFDGERFIASLKEKTAIERELVHIIKEALSAGNIIILIEDIKNFIDSAKVFGVDVLAVMNNYLSHLDLQFIATSTMSAYNEYLQKNEIVSERFDVVKVLDHGKSNSLNTIKSITPYYEGKYGVFFTYPALVRIVESANRYYVGSVASDKVSDLLDGVTSYVRNRGSKVITSSDVDQLVEKQTGVPLGETSQADKTILLDLEKELHKMVIGQDEAIVAISNAMRRSKSGISNSEKPLGSFLFLGPTGVGKTETSKALTTIFFKQQENMIRLDMSEYAGPDAIPKLIGSYGAGKSGMLVEKIRQHPYGVVLLDEFEKTVPEVKDIFLQILDEGYFTDSSGKKVFMRDMIIIATSNAGSDMIWDLSSRGISPESKKEEIISSIISNGIFKPELLNRFDGIIFFHPLSVENLREVARLMLIKLQKRLYENNINFQITDELIDYVASAGYDPKFGARPMNRVIQDKIEGYVSKGILSGEILKGDKVILDVSKIV